MTSIISKLDMKFLVSSVVHMLQVVGLKSLPIVDQQVVVCLGKVQGQ